MSTMSIKGLLLASDPEIFVRDSKGNISSVSGKLGCDKWNKLTVSNDIRIQEDNVLVEFDINPHDSFSKFNDNLIRGIGACENIIGEHGLVIAPNVSSHIFTPGELASFGEGVLVFGCEPDYNALTGARNPKPQAADPGLRTSGGHVHFGFSQIIADGNFMEAQKVMGVMCDYFMGLPSLLLDKDDRRRELYGKAGSVRFKDYGIEYRTLSNFWLFDGANRKWVWDQGLHAFSATESGEWRELAAMLDPNEVQRVINENDKAMAEALVKKFKLA